MIKDVPTFGWYVARLDDLDGDGHADVAVGACLENVAENTPAGGAYEPPRNPLGYLPDAAASNEPQKGTKGAEDRILLLFVPLALFRGHTAQPSSSDEPLL